MDYEESVPNNKRSFNERVSIAAMNVVQHHELLGGLTLLAITNDDEQPLAVKALKSAGFRVAKHFVNGQTGNDLTLWIRMAR